MGETFDTKENKADIGYRLLKWTCRKSDSEIGPFDVSLADVS